GLIGDEAVWADVRRVKRKRILLDVGGLRVDGPTVGVWWGRPSLLGAFIAELIVQAESDALHGEIRLELLSPCGKGHVMGAEHGEHVLERRGPVCGDRHLDASSRRQTIAP